MRKAIIEQTGEIKNFVDVKRGDQFTIRPADETDNVDSSIIYEADEDGFMNANNVGSVNASIVGVPGIAVEN